ncbi:hypothetical protein HMPREF2954_04635 [Neisseria sp. HMSC067H09]|nr:hypothetical protein HMPREF3156_02257 [Neisseria sp. HMSC06F02]OFS03011.1 hypothetical protein HMPREF2954_04635 [Neisseria sp. HMSC067H09]
MADSRGVSDGAAACGRGRFNFLKDREKRRFLLFYLVGLKKGFQTTFCLKMPNLHIYTAFYG